MSENSDDATTTFTVEIGAYQSLYQPIRAIREAVFIQEQSVPRELDIDGQDDQCTHAVIWSENSGIGTGRLEPTGKIGRIAVLRPFRRCGVGTHIMSALEHAAKVRNLRKVYLHAQTTALGFYEQLGYQTCSDVFFEASIPHQSMEKLL